MDTTARNDGLILRLAASYGSAADADFAAIWTPAGYQARFDAQTSVS